MNILITGANGLLGQALVDECIKKNIDFIAASKGKNRNPNCPNKSYKKLDVTNPNQVLELLNNLKPTHVVNTAAMTNVDNCEALPDECHQLNVCAVEYLFEWCKSNNAHFQQISTDFIFDGKQGDYKEEAIPNPLSEYGKSKLQAEKVLIHSKYENYSIIRTSVVYGTGYNLSKSNIVLWALDALKQKKRLTIVSDQFRTPTWSEDLAKGCLGIILNKKKGIYNIVGPTQKSMFDFVVEIAKYLKVSEELVVPIPTGTLNQVAERPAMSGLNIDKARLEFNYKPTPFYDSLSKLELK